MRKLGQPLVIAEVIAGIVLGPSLFGWVSPELSADLFPRASMGQLFMMSQVGLILFIFLIGLELDLGHLRGRVKSSVAISHASIVVPCSPAFSSSAVFSKHTWA